MPNIVEQIIAAAQRPSSERTALYCARLDDHLETLPDDAARAAYCGQQAKKWVSDYEQWAMAVDSGRIAIGPGKPCAWDYTMTIAAINERKGRYERQAAALEHGRAG